MPSAVKLLLVLAATGISVSLAEEGKPERSNEERLITGLLAGLTPAGKIARPVPASGDNVTVELSLTLMRVASLKDKVAEIDVWTTMKWTDPRLAWDPEAYDGISHVTLPDELIWLPDIRPYYAIEYKPATEMVDGVWVSNSGHVTYALPARIKLDCIPAGNRSVSCLMVMSSLIYLGDQLDLILPGKDKSTADILVAAAGGRILVENANVDRREIYVSIGTLVHLEYSLTLRRKDERGKARKSPRKSHRRS